MSTTTTLINAISQSTNGEAVFIGSIARFYNGDTGSYSDVDVWIPPSALSSLQNDFNLISVTAGWTFVESGSEYIHQYGTKSNGRRWYHDIFVSNETPSSSIHSGSGDTTISASKFLTADHDLHMHQRASSSKGDTYWTDKYAELQSLYA